VWGLVFGSFLNVCIYRIPRDLSIVRPRSFCPECAATIGWRDNIPLVSYFLLRGKCRTCGVQIGYRYPLVELATAILFALVVYRYGLSAAAGKWALFECLMVILFCTDLEERILPDELTLGGAAVGLALAFLVTVPGVLGELFFPDWTPPLRSACNAILGMIFLAGPLWLLGALYAQVRRREGVGLGDVKLLLIFGAFLGLESGLMALLIGAVSGSVLGLIYLIATKRSPAETELPFGTFLCAGAAILPLAKSL